METKTDGEILCALWEWAKRGERINKKELRNLKRLKENTAQNEKEQSCIAREAKLGFESENGGDKFYYVIRYLASLSITNRQK